jgi:hypothetical protein
MLDHGMTLSAGASQGDGAPDFHIQGNEPFWIECVCPGPGNRKNEVPDIELVNIKTIAPDYQFDFSDEPETLTDARLLRITSVIAKKREQYAKRIQTKTISDDDRYVITINTDGIDSRWGDFFEDWGTGVPEILKAVYPIGDFAGRIDLNTDSVDWMHLPRPQIPNADGKPVDTQFFFNAGNACISGILFAEMRIVEPNKPHFLFAPNPNARNQFMSNPFPWADEYRCDFDKTNKTYQLTKTPASST